jgi:hypothetical protein
MNSITADVLLGLLLASPWLVASLYFWHVAGRDDAIAPSLGERARARWLS